jgi:hypothetical protein
MAMPRKVDFPRMQRIMNALKDADKRQVILVGLPAAIRIVIRTVENLFSKNYVSHHVRDAKAAYHLAEAILEKHRIAE